MTGLTVTMLGCGPSGGVPLMGCTCHTCSSTDPRNKRTRASILVEQGGTRILVDTAPDLRAQALREGFHTVDAILFTHAHADHTHGIDDTRSFTYHKKGALRCYGTQATMDEIAERFSYAFHAPVEGQRWYRPSLEVQVIEDYERFTIGNMEIQSFFQHHGKVNCSGYRIGNFAYSTDVNNLPAQSLQLLEKLDVWVVDCLQPDPAPTHANLDQTLAWIDQLKPKRAILTHMGHHLEYHALKAQLPPGVEPAYDGMKITIP